MPWDEIIGLADTTVELPRSSSLRLSQTNVIPGVTQQCTPLNKVLQISCRRGAGRSGDTDIIFCAPTTLKPSMPSRAPSITLHDTKNEL